MKIAEVIREIGAGQHPTLRVVRLSRSLKEWWADFMNDRTPPLYRVQVRVDRNLGWDTYKEWVTISTSRSEVNALSTALLIANRAKRGGVCGYACLNAHGPLSE